MVSPGPHHLMISGRLSAGRFPNHSPSHFDLFKFKPVNVENVFTVLNASLKSSVVLTINVKSSANCWIFNSFPDCAPGNIMPLILSFCLILRASSSAAKMNISGEAGQPCRMPHLVGNHSDSHPACWTELIVFFKRIVIHFLKLYPKSKVFNVSIR